MKRRVYLAGLMIATAVAMEPLAMRLTAFATNGHIWGVRQVPYYINPANKYMSDSSAIAGITSAASTWKGAANISLVYSGYTNKSSLTNDGVNAVFFRDDSSGYIAETYWWWDGTGRLIDADIVYHENSKFYSGNMGCNGDGFYIENTGAHEFGHLLGLGHSSVEIAAMWPNSGACETIRETLDPDDIAGLQSLYGGPTTSTTTPSAPSSLAAAAGSSSPTSSIALSWSDNSTNESGYVVERSSDGATFAQRAQLATGASSYLDSGLASGTTYYYRVYAYNSAGSSTYSNVASAQTQASSSATSTAPSSPANPSPADGATGINANITLGWTGANAQSYDVYLNGALVASRVTSTSWRAGQLPAGTTYSWMVVANNSAGSTSGPTWRFTTRPAGKK
jgi:Matrixin/Fibronectin type III domain